jgi:hypothetical protein
LEITSTRPGTLGAASKQQTLAHWSVSFDGDIGTTELDGILVCDFDADGRCTLHREWYDRREPFA